MVGSEIEEYTTKHNEHAGMCPDMVTPVYKRIEHYLTGLVPHINGMVTSSRPVAIHEAVRLAHKLTNQAIEQGLLPPRGAMIKTPDVKRKWETVLQSSSPTQPPHQQRRNESPSFVNVPDPTIQKTGAYAGKYPKCPKCSYHHPGPWSNGVLETLRIGFPGHRQ